MARAATGMRCQIYLAAPSDTDGALLARLLGRGSVASLLLRDADGGPPARDAAQAVLSIAHGHGVPLVIAEDAELAGAIVADGVHIAANEALYQAARERLGSDAIIGADCGLSRHDALVLAERGADYVAFGGEGLEDCPATDAAEHVNWWQEVCEPPVVAWHCGGWDEAAALVAAGADFLAVSRLVLRAEDPEEALERLERLIVDQFEE